MIRQSSNLRRRWNARLRLAAAAAAVIAVAQSRGLAQISWTGNANNGSWSNPNNWNPQTVPGSATAGDTVDITTTGPSGVTVNYDYTGSAGTLGDVVINLTGGTGGATNTLSMSANVLTSNYEDVGDSYIGGGSNGSGTFTQSGGTNTVNTELNLGDAPTDTGIYNLSGSGSLTSNESEAIGLNGTGTFNQNGGTNTLSSAGYNLYLGYGIGSSGTYNLNSGALNDMSSDYPEVVGDYGTGNFYQMEGTTNTIAATTIVLGWQPDSQGTYYLRGGVLTTTVSGSADTIGFYGTGTFNQTGGIFNVNGDCNIDIAYYAGSSGTYNLSAGAVNIGNDLVVGGSQTLGQGGQGTFNISGTGIANISGGIIGYSGSTLVLSGGLLNVENNGIASAASPITTVELPAPGQTAGIQSLGGAGINGAGLDMNGGGTLLLIGTNNFYSGGTTIAAGSVIQVGGFGGIYSTFGSISSAGNIDDEGALQFSQSNNITVSAAISGGGTVIGDSSGTTTLSGINTYSGATNIPFGTLAVNGELYHGVGSAPNVNVSGGTLAGTGTIHSGITLNYGTIAPGLAGSTLSADEGLTAYGGTLQFDVGTSNASELVLGGAASFQGGVNVDFTLSGSPANNSVFTILTSTGLIGAGMLDLTPTVIDGDTLTPSISGNDLIVTVSGGGGGGGGPPSSLIWNNAGGSGDGTTWDVNNNQNWNNGSPAVYTDGSDVTFNDNNNSPFNPNAYNVTLNTPVTPDSVTVNNSLGNYTISGTGSITGTASLTKSGTGTLTLSTKNTYSGGTFVDGGTLVIAPTDTFGAALPDGPVTIGAAGTLQLADNAGAIPLVNPLDFQILKMTSLSIATGGVLDIRNNNFNVADPGGIPDDTTFTNLYGYIKTGAITSTEGFPGYGIGLVDGNDGVSGTPLSANQIEVAYTLEGDANLDGKVDATDFGIFAPNFGLSTTLGWEAGDFNYDGKVDATDFGLFAPNFGLTDSGTAVSLPTADYAALDAFAAANGLSLTSVPEPASAAMMIVAGCGILRRRRHHRIPAGDRAQSFL